MTKKPKHQISHAEPAERPVSVSLSQGELYALLVHHEKEIKRVTRAAIKTIGQHANTKKDIDAVRKEANRQIEAHQRRAKGLGAILQSTIES